jgi:hypothetical protein
VGSCFGWDVAGNSIPVRFVLYWRQDENLAHIDYYFSAIAAGSIIILFWCTNEHGTGLAYRHLPTLLSLGADSDIDIVFWNNRLLAAYKTRQQVEPGIVHYLCGDNNRDLLFSKVSTPAFILSTIR